MHNHYIFTEITLRKLLHMGPCKYLYARDENRWGEGNKLWF